MEHSNNSINDKIWHFIKDNIVIILSFVLLAIIESMVPLASGDDWTFRTWYQGLQNAPGSMLWLYLFFNGRPTLYYTFSFCLYYFKIWFLVTPISFILILSSIKDLFKLNGKLAHLMIITLHLCFSWDICRNIYLWPTGNSAYLLPWAIMLRLFAYITHYKEETFKWYLSALGVFLISLGNENASIAMAAMLLVYWIICSYKEKKSNVHLFINVIAAVVSALLCILNPAGQRYELAMSSVTVSFPVMVHDNLNTLCKFIVEQNAFLFLVLTILVLLNLKKDFHYFKNRALMISYICFISIGAAILLFTSLPLGDLGKTFGYSNDVANHISNSFELAKAAIFANNLFISLLWFIYIFALIGSLWFIKDVDSCYRIKFIALFVFAITSSGCFAVLPEISQRSMFYALSILIIYATYLTSRVTLKQVNYKNCFALLCFVLLLRVDAFMFVLVPAKLVSVQRSEISKEFLLQRGLGKADDIDIIYFPKYAEGTINWDDSNINPTKEMNPYAYEAMKDYYGIPWDVDVQYFD